jgi:hypothetical protein
LERTHSVRFDSADTATADRLIRKEKKRVGTSSQVSINTLIDKLISYRKLRRLDRLY